MKRRDSFRSLTEGSFGHETQITERESTSLVEQSSVRNRVRYLVHSLVQERSVQDEICQEVLIHLWRCELRMPGQSIDYYLRSCCFCVQDLLKAGRSVHCLRHRSMLSMIEEDFEDSGAGSVRVFVSAEETLCLVCVRDAFAQLFRLLEPLEKRILLLLSCGHHVREIARQLRISHSTVSKHRSRIAEKAVSIGFSPEVGFHAPIRMTK